MSRRYKKGNPVYSLIRRIKVNIYCMCDFENVNVYISTKFRIPLVYIKQSTFEERHNALWDNARNKYFVYMHV